MNQRIGYARTSLEDPHLDLQRDALLLAGCDVIYEETINGNGTTRPELELCRKALRSGDTLVVWRLDRLGRSLRDLVLIVSDFERSGIGFESLSDQIETNSFEGKAILQVFTALGEFERSLVRERTHVGFVAARTRGRNGGRKPKLGDEQVREIKALLDNPDNKVAEIARRYDVSRTTLYKYVGVVSPKT